MERKTVYVIIIISSLGLLGIFFTQLYWVRESFRLKEEQFANSVRIALKGVANQMLIYELVRDESESDSGSHAQVPHLPDPRNISEALLDFKITEEFNCMHVGKDYSYGIINLETGKLLLGKYGKHEAELLSSPHRIPMTGFLHSDHMMLTAYFHNQSNMLLMRMINWLVLSLVFALLLVLSFYFTIFFLFRQKKLSEMKSDFINNMTHEFKTPLATISLASEMLMKKNVSEDPCKTGRYAKIIFEENARLQGQVEQILNISLLERGEFNLKLKEVNIHELISSVVANFTIITRERKGAIHRKLNASNHIASVDKMHFINVISNLLDNANKYSPEAPDITIETENYEDGIVISVEDKGIGISMENQKLIFKNLYRVPTGNIHNVKGFGIGLFYVKTIVEAHGGHIKLLSEPQKGSRFDVFLPIISKSDQNEGS
jgi:two-component system, OmpR family, phosphate regulon sensor histidine kinase PhoR